MNFTEQINFFEKTYPELVKETNKIKNQLVAAFKERLHNLKPIIAFMKKKEVYFTHPDLKNIRTLHGVIIGQNINDDELYYYNGDDDYVYGVKINNDKKLSSKLPLKLDNYVFNCDLEFALNGIVQTEKQLELAIEQTKEFNEKLNSFIDKFKEVDNS